MADVQARLDAAINAHLAGVLLPRGAILTSNVTRGWIDRFEALVALRARLEERVECFRDRKRIWRTELIDEAERLLGEGANV